MKKILLFLFSVILINNLSGLALIAKSNQDTKPDSIYISSQLQELKNDLEQLINDPDFSNAQIGVSIQSLKTGEYIFRKNEAKNFIPASVQKIITTSAALELLGPDYKFLTNLYLQGEIKKNGEFEGNIIIRAYGDPTISDQFYDAPFDIMDRWVYIFDSLGINSINGDIIGDDRYFDKVNYAPGWAWDDMAEAFSAQCSALSFYDNRVDLIVEQGDSVGAKTKIKIQPPNNYVRILNNVITGGNKDVSDISAERESQTNLIELNGQISFDSTKKNTIVKSVAIDNPTIFFLNIFKERLNKNNIRFKGNLIDINNATENYNYFQLKALKGNQSKALSEIVKKVNKQSNNLIAEMLLKTIGKENSGTGSRPKGIEYINDFLAKKGISPEKIEMIDGSGLSRMNLISPIYITNLLSYIYQSNYKDVFINSLAVPGEDGTLKRRMTNTLAEKNLFAKTGSMENINNIAGFVYSRDKEPFAFAILINNFSVPQSVARNLQDLICMRLASFSRRK